jgi:hypothetical protein
MVKSNRLKQTKHRRRTKHRRQTKHGRHRQYGGVNITYIDYTRILKPGQNQKNVVIPGYQEIVDMIKEYNNDTSLITTLNGGILMTDVVRYMDCNSPESSTPENSIIVLRKQKTFFGSNRSIDCGDEIYYQLASHNFRIFIKDILQWNPFLNIPIKEKK